MRIKRKQGLVAAGLPAVLLLASRTLLPAQQPEDGVRSFERPLRNFGPARSISPAIVVRDEGDDPALRQALAAELKRLSAELFVEQGWTSPFGAGDPLTILVSRRTAPGVPLLTRGMDRGALVAPAIEVGGPGASNQGIVHDAARLFARAVISAYGVTDSGFLSDAAAELLSAAAPSEAQSEAARIALAAPTVRVPDQPLALGRAVLDEFAAEAGGRAALRAVWERARDRAETPEESLVGVYAERTGERPEVLLLRSVARLYALLDSEPGPSALGLYDLFAGALDASAPGPWTLRHRVYVPSEAGALRFHWPAGAGAGAAIVRYRDGDLPSDLVWLDPDTDHRMAFSGVARVDFVVAGTPSPEGPQAPVFFEAMTGYPFEGIQPHAAASTDGSRMSWTTVSHEGLAGWAVFREEVLPDGRIARADPQIVPSSAESAESYRYAYLDPTVRPGTFYRYTVWAVTEEGLLAKAFSATLRASE